MNKNLKAYLPLVDFLADYLGEHTEVVLHDLTDLEHSIVKIRNGRISGRHEGDPCTDFVLRVLQQKCSVAPYNAQYSGTGCNGGRLKSGSYYIRDDDGSLIGMICINIETELYHKALGILDSVFGVSSNLSEKSEHGQAQESFRTSIGEMVDDILSRAIAECGYEPRMLPYESKVQLIEKLDAEGIFLLKGSIGKTAAALGISEPSVYRYLTQSKKG